MNVENHVKKEAKNKVIVKVGMLGDSQIGKTTLMVKYIEDKYDEDYIETLGVNFMEKTIHLKNVDVTLSVWDLGGQREFEALMPLVCSDAKAILFAFDLMQRNSLFSVKRWYKEARKENKVFLPFLIGTKFDLFESLGEHEKKEISKQARKFARKMHAPLIYCSSSKSINVKKIFKIILANVFKLKPKVKEQHDETSEAIIEYNLKQDNNNNGNGDNGGGGDDQDDDEEEDENVHHKKHKKDEKKKDKEKKKKDKEQQQQNNNNNIVNNVNVNNNENNINNHHHHHGKKEHKKDKDKENKKEHKKDQLASAANK